MQCGQGPKWGAEISQNLSVAENNPIPDLGVPVWPLSAPVVDVSPKVCSRNTPYTTFGSYHGGGTENLFDAV